MEKETKMYEIGYLLSPLIHEEKLDEEISVLRKLIEDRHGLIMNEDRAKMRKLAYNIQKPAVGKFDSAHFGWMKFVASPEILPEIEISLGKTANIIRFLLIEAAKEEPIKKPARKIIRPVPLDGQRLERKAASPAEPKIKTEVKPEEIDKRLEELLGN